MGIAGIAGIVTLLIVTLFSVKALAKNYNSAPGKLLVAVVDAPPFYIKTPDGRWEGLSIELWHGVAQKLGVQYELREYKSFGEIVAAVENKEVDVITAMPVTKRTEILMDFSNPFLR